MTIELAPLDRLDSIGSTRPAGRSGRRLALVRELIFRAPRLGCRCADATIRMLHLAGRTGPRPRALAPLVAGIGHARLGRLARDIAANSFKSECVDLLKHRSGASHRLRESLLSTDGKDVASAIRGPTVVATFHAGPMLAARWALERAAIPTLVLAYHPQVEMDAGHLRIDTEGAPAASRAGIIVQAVSFLKRHERSVVLMAPDDGLAGRPVPVELLGARMRFRPGAAAIARLAGADLVPMMARWTTMSRIEVCAGDASRVASRADEPEATLGLARFVEAQFEGRPEDLSTFYVARLTESAKS